MTRGRKRVKQQEKVERKKEGKNLKVKIQTKRIRINSRREKVEKVKKVGKERRKQIMSVKIRTKTRRTRTKGKRRKEPKRRRNRQKRTSFRNSLVTAVH